MKNWRICITRCGYAVAPGDTPDQALAYVGQNMNERDFDWEPVNADLIAAGEVIEPCEADGSVTLVSE